MIDYFALALAHGLLVIALLRLAGSDRLDVDRDGDDPPTRPKRNARRTNRRA